MEQHPNPKIAYLVAIVLVLFVAAAGYGLTRMNRVTEVADTTPTPTPSITSTATPMPSATADPTANWLAYTATSTAPSFKYPASWGKYSADIFDDSGDGPGVVCGQTLVDFDNGPALNLGLSFTGKDDTGSPCMSSIQVAAFKNLYNERTAPTTVSLDYLIQINAALLAASEPVYFETADEKYRGMSFFATFSQDGDSNAPYTFTNYVALATDGKSVFQAMQSLATDSEYVVVKGHNPDATSVEGRVPKALKEKYEKELQYFTETFGK